MNSSKKKHSYQDKLSGTRLTSSDSLSQRSNWLPSDALNPFFFGQKTAKNSQDLQMETLPNTPKMMWFVVLHSEKPTAKINLKILRKKPVNKLSVKEKSRFGHVVFKKNQHCMVFLKGATKKNIFYFPWNPGYLIGITIIIPTLLGSFSPPVYPQQRGALFHCSNDFFCQEKFHTLTKSWYFFFGFLDMLVLRGDFCCEGFSWQKTALFIFLKDVFSKDCF